MKHTLLLGASVLALTATAIAQPGATALQSQVLDRSTTSILSTSGQTFGLAFMNTAAEGFLQNAGNPNLAPTSQLVYQATLDNGVAAMMSPSIRLRTSTDGGKTFSPDDNSRLVYSFNAPVNLLTIQAFNGYRITAHENHVFIFVIDELVDSMGNSIGTSGVFAIGSDDQGQTFSDPVLLTTYADPAIANAPGSLLDQAYPGYLALNPSFTLNLINTQQLSADSSRASNAVPAPLTGEVYATAVWEARFQSSPAISGIAPYNNPEATQFDEEVYSQTVYVERVGGLPVLRTAFPNEVVLTEDINGLGLHVADADLDGPQDQGNTSVVCEGDVVAVAYANEDDAAIGATTFDENTIEVRVSTDASLSFANTLAPSIRVDDFSGANPSPRPSSNMDLDVDNGKVYLVWGSTLTSSLAISGPDTPTLAVIDTNSGTPVLDPLLSGTSPVVMPATGTDSLGNTINFDGLDTDGINITVEDGVIMILARLDVSSLNSNEIVAFIDRNDGADILARNAEFIQLTDNFVSGTLCESDFKNEVGAGLFSQGENADGDMFMLLTTDGGVTFRKERVTDGADETSPGAGNSAVEFEFAQLALTPNGSVHIAMQDLRSGPVIATGQRYPRLEVELAGPLENFIVRDAKPGNAIVLLLGLSGQAPNDLTATLGLNSVFDATICLNNDGFVLASLSSVFGLSGVGPDGSSTMPLALPAGILPVFLPGFDINMVGLELELGPTRVRSYTDPIVLE
ncbi:MAG: sialidase family protein [Planctomycetota bacterium]